MTNSTGITGTKMKRTHQLVKLRIETVDELKRLMKQMGTGSLDDLVLSMISRTDAHRLNLKESGWEIPSKGCRK